MEAPNRTTIETPLELVTSVADFRFSPKIDARLQALMDRNTEGQLSEAEREELEALVRQAKLGASCGVKVPAEEGLTNHSYRVLQLWRKQRGRAERNS